MDVFSDPGLMLYLQLYELDGASFASKDAYRHLGTVHGAVWRPSGYLFDGTDDDVDLGNVSQLNFGTGSFTVVFWDAFDGSEGCALKKYDTALTRGYYLIVSASGNAYLCLRRESGIYIYRATATGGRSGGEWGHFAFTADRAGNTITCFFNGEIGQGSQVEAGGFNSSTNIGNSQHFYLGERWFGGEPHYGGTIGEVWIYNRVLSPLEVQHNYLVTKGRYR